jgi:ABC-type lipoprotein release transport system permease subunit
MNAAARRWAARTLRRRWRSVALLVVLTALAGGAALTATVGAHRSRIVVDQMMTEHRQPDVMSLPDAPGFDWRPIVRLPYVESYGLMAATVLCLNETGGLGKWGAEALCTQPPVSGGWYRSIWRLDVLEGRMPTGPREIAINRLAQRKYGWKLGDRLHVAGIRPRRLEDFWAGRPRGSHSWGPTFEVTVTAVFRGEEAWRVLTGGLGQPGFVMSASFIPTYGHSLEYREQAFLRLRNGEADVARLRRDVARITHDPAFPIRDVQDGQRRVERGTTVEAVALALFAAAVLAAAAALLGPALIRLIGAEDGDARTLRSLGMARGSLVAALAAPGVVVGVLGAAGAVLIAVAASPLIPIGLARTFELHGGIKVDLPVLALGAFGIVLATALTAVAAAAVAVRRGRRAPGGAGRIAVALTRLPLPPSVALGVRMALERRPGADSILVRSGLIGAIVGVMAVVGAFTLRHAVAETLSHPERAGQTWEIAYYPGLSEKVIANDPDIAGAAKVTSAPVDLHGVPVPTYAIRPVGRPLHVVVLAGRSPVREDEIAIAPSTAHLLHVGIGDTVSGGPHGARRVRVVGRALLVEDGGHAAYDEGAWTTDAGLKRLAPPHVDWTYYFVHVRPGANVAQLRRRLEAAGGVVNEGWAPPAALANLHTTRNVPTFLGVLLALLAVGAVGHTLVTTERRRRRDLAVLRALGMSRGQARAVLAWQATTVAIVGLALGVPLGILAGHLVWRWIAASMPLAYVGPGVTLAAALVVPAALLVANAVAAWPARRAARARPATVLRAE